MTVEYAITPELRIKLKDPYGTLIQGTFNETMDAMKKLMEEEKPPKLISVGDVVSLNLHKHGIHPQLTIIDNKSLRSRTMPETVRVEKTVCVANPQGTITKEAVGAIREAIEKNEHTHIVIDGEEDLLTLIVVLYAPENSFVVYGQPHEGIVVVKVTAQKKAEVKKFLKAMEIFEKLNRKKTV
jgi:GTP-dependent dephospho-CoA kinase